MESIKSKKYRKKKKKPTNTDDCETIIKPECFDGMSNWLNFKKTLITTERVPKKFKKSVKDKNFKRPFKKPRLSHSAPTMPIHEKKIGTQDNDDSGCISDTDLSPGPSSGARSKQNGHTSEHQNIDPDDLNVLTPVLAMDCEMVGTGEDGKDSMVARVSIVNTYGQCVYDTFVKPTEKVTDFRTAVSGVRPSDLKNGKELSVVQKEVSDIIEGKKVVGHALKFDFDVLYISHPRSHIRDTSKYKPFRELFGGRTPSLKKLTSVILGCDIQNGEHNSIEDSQAAMLLYLRHKKDWERQIKMTRRKKLAE